MSDIMQNPLLICYIFVLLIPLLQLDAMKLELEKFYGKDPLKSGDLSRIVNANHFHRLSKLLDDNKVVDKVVHGGQRDENNL